MAHQLPELSELNQQDVLQTRMVTLYYVPEPLLLLAPVVRARVEGQRVARAGGVAEHRAPVHVEVHAGAVADRAPSPAAATPLRFMIVIASALGLG